jgi:thiol:disulfide interchange protein DsbD
MTTTSLINLAKQENSFMRLFSRTWVFLCLLISLQSIVFQAHAQLGGSFEDPFANEPEFLDVDQAFMFDFNQTGDKLSITFAIADGYYLYKKQFKYVTKQADIGEPTYPEGTTIQDEFFGESEVFYNTVTINIPIEKAEKDSVVKVRYQGCADAGLCYPPTVKVVYLSALASGGETAVNTEERQNKATQIPKSEQFLLADKLINKENLPLTLALFFALGIGLAFTPCVFPMYPIVSGIVIGQGKPKTTSHAFWLTLVYVQGMAITYSLLGLAVAVAGAQFQAALQHPVILGVFIALFVVLAVALFGGFEIQLPAKYQEKLTHMSNNQTPGSFVGVFIMGVLSGLIASPCTTAPLTGILLFVAQTGDMTLGFISLYLLSVGMGVPLILFGMTGGKLLPKAGNWMNVVKVTFGFMMLAVAIVFIERLWSSPYSDFLWAALAFGLFGYYWAINRATANSAMKLLRAIIVAMGIMGSIGMAYQAGLNSDLWGASEGVEQETVKGNLETVKGAQETVKDDPETTDGIQEAVTDVPETTKDVQETVKGHPEFVIARDLSDLRSKIADANAQGKTVMVDLYADWCAACKEFEKYTFPQANVVEALSNTVWMQMDLTDNTPERQEVFDEFTIFGLPTILFFNTAGNEVGNARVTGFMNADDFTAHVNATVNATTDATVD